ncbi:helix-turn-helix domain-containing protein [Pleomorphomonas koreensis]|uniref:helix-turn-helix domain-containing protein n=1 Tax=Pleomorphomonas koreensis TaxID=257440 RepID=UPI0009FCF735|nr:XRE family transcriptional regulator [Pleomorphomonas koreensis]
MRPSTKGFFVPARLLEAREARGMTQSDVAKALGRPSGSTISNWESGEQSPEPATLDQLASVLGVWPSYLIRPMQENGARAIFFRSLATATKKVRTREKARMGWLRHISAALQEIVEFPEVDFPEFVAPNDYLKLSDDDLNGLAASIRRHWLLGEGPIESMVLVAENAGAVVGVDEVGSTKIDGQGTWSDSEGRPYILLARDKNTAYRRQMDAAHEIAHLALHRYVNDNDMVRHFDLIEHQAKYLACAILLPHRSFSSEIPSLSLDGFLSMKRRWRVSIGAMVKRAHDLGIISDEHAKRLWRYRSARGWHSREPLDLPSETPVEEPRLLRRSIELVIDERVRGVRDLVEMDIGIDSRDVEMMTCLPQGYLTAEAAAVVALQPRLKDALRSQLEQEDGNVVAFRPKR